MPTEVPNGYIWTLTVLPSATLLSALIAGSGLWFTDDPGLPIFIWLLGGAGTVVLAFFDWDALSRAGVTRPLHWAWSFFTIANLSLVYVIGRSIVAKRNRAGKYGPAWLSGTLLFATIVLSTALGVLAVWVFVREFFNQPPE
jgi:hypothetical protein